MQKNIFLFQDISLRKLHDVGLKAAQLCELERLGGPVSPGFVLGTGICNHFLKAEHSFPSFFDEQLKQHLQNLEDETGHQLGNSENPLLLIMRPSEPLRMADVFKSSYCIGLNRSMYDTLLKKFKNPVLVHLIYERFYQRYSSIIKGPAPEIFNQIKKEFYETHRFPADHVLKKSKFLCLLDNFEKVYSPPEDAFLQIKKHLTAQYRNWLDKPAAQFRKLRDIDEKIGMAIIIQQSVFAEKEENSGIGIAFSRNPITGERAITGEYLPASDGYDVRKGSNDLKDLKLLKEKYSVQYGQIKKLLILAEKHFGESVGFEFALEHNKLFLLGIFPWKKSGLASVRIAVEMYRENLINEIEALNLLEPQDMNYFVLPMIDPSFRENSVFKGIPASPGAASGKAVFSLEQAEKLAAEKESPILIRRNTSPEDISGLDFCTGIVTSQGGMTSHAAVIARTLGKAAITGCADIAINQTENYLMTGGGFRIDLYDEISINGSSGEVFPGIIPMITASNDENFKQIMDWSSKYCSMEIRINSDSPEATIRAMEFGIDGIGLCRTEHMFFVPERIDTMRSMILSKETEERKVFLEILYDFLKEDLGKIFSILNGKPLCVRLLDPPLQAFLPKTDEDLANYSLRAGRDYEDMKTQADALRQSNPMMGLRGCRLPIVYPEITKMQVQAIIDAAIEVNLKGIDVNPEIMLPLISTAREIEFMCEIMEKTIEEQFIKHNHRLNYQFGAMIETPRACLRADKIAEFINFISFGTNDLTQLVYGFSRDDIGQFLDVYIDNGMLNNDPFQVLDLAGIGKIINFAVNLAKQGNPSIRLASCGEQNSNQKTIQFFSNSNFDYISCTPLQVPVVKVAAAQSTLKKFKVFRKK